MDPPVNAPSDRTGLDSGLNTSEDTMMRRLWIGSFHVPLAAGVSGCGPGLSRHAVPWTIAAP